MAQISTSRPKTFVVAVYRVENASASHAHARWYGPLYTEAEGDHRESLTYFISYPSVLLLLQRSPLPSPLPT